MYLVHMISHELIEDLLNYGYIKSLSLLQKDGKKIAGEYGWGYGTYPKSNMIFFTAVDVLFDKYTYSCVMLYFDSKVLYNKSFYINKYWESDSEKHGKKYDRYYSNKKLIQL